MQIFIEYLLCASPRYWQTKFTQTSIYWVLPICQTQFQAESRAEDEPTLIGLIGAGQTEVMTAGGSEWWRWPCMGRQERLLWGGDVWAETGSEPGEYLGRECSRQRELGVPSPWHRSRRKEQQGGQNGWARGCEVQGLASVLGVVVKGFWVLP